MPDHLQSGREVCTECPREERRQSSRTPAAILGDALSGPNEASCMQEQER
jgi:hypothetical protein